VIASVVVPTTGDRATLLAHSVGSVLAQTVDDLEVLVVGDGASDATRDWAESVDARVRFFGFDKDGRRGEVHRHRVLTAATSSSTSATGTSGCRVTSRRCSGCWPTPTSATRSAS
jgi:cellulose synthase/poly-beta-1,6-N-acetylglucosamine synthase-like glycosyltransferase